MMLRRAARCAAGKSGLAGVPARASTTSTTTSKSASKTTSKTASTTKAPVGAVEDAVPSKGHAQTLREWAAQEQPDVKGLDVTNVKATLRTYLDPKEGKELREMHRGYARQYQKVYGYTIASFVFAAAFAYSAGVFAGTSTGKEKEQSSTPAAPA